MLSSVVQSSKNGARLHYFLRNGSYLTRCSSPVKRLPHHESSRYLSRSFSSSRPWHLAAQASAFEDVSVQDTADPSKQNLPSKSYDVLPQTCPGCGALTQESSPANAGYYSRSRKAVKRYFNDLKEQGAPKPDLNPVEETQDRTPTTAQSDETKNIENDVNVQGQKGPEPRIPLCDRCHDLTFNARGQSIAHPSLQDIADSIGESAFRRNHVYHVLDAADFPMSLIPTVYSKLSLAQPRSQNRRSQHDFSSKPTMSFIITRSDLLGPTKEIVDSMMPYFQATLRKALGRSSQGQRLGNVHLVSAKRGWWTNDIKESIWQRGGGNWMVGKVNVGKSNLFEVIFPKGTKHRAVRPAEDGKRLAHRHVSIVEASREPSRDYLSENSLLTPAQPEAPFPVLPLVSSLPGTTASPIRIPFGRRKGELIDLPGLDRGSLEDFVDSQRQLDLVMTHRPNVVQLSIKPGQSLILGGGLVRITPQWDASDKSIILLAYSFVPIPAHVSSTEKAIQIQQQERETGIKSILADGVGAIIKSAGMFALNTDVTKQRAGPLLRAGISLSRLPFRVYATDILLEGVGWVELVCQVRRQKDTAQHDSADSAATSGRVTSIEPPGADISLKPNPSFTPFSKQSGDLAAVSQKPNTDEWPVVEVFSPNGKHIAQRQSLGAWSRWNEGRQQQRKQ